ncbi:glycosyltransferase [Brevibacillus fulvus]|uniref:Glycosyltransferase involved in cell wall biosynthesis n=1 Tax=Brevibacillus fulvus TaxID=1125967 RepID=A0A939BWF1_9BACL|nr:glycosyltransferase family 2 protein [Brevibacillus fulvus]MBM7591751.1 glycosyltransferase involved in cell wall biosynthesis [Brevibacillus fulvus]
MITISLCLIAKNEEKTIGNCLESVKGIVDEIIVVDTGSTDRTTEIVRQYTDKIYHFEWIDDFAAARNYAFRLATQEYILWLDADDVLLEEDQQKLLQLKETLDPSVDSVTMHYHYAFDEFGRVSYSFRRNRLVKRARQFRWHGAVHEYLAVSGNILNSDIAVTHRRINSHSGRNLAIFEKRLAKGEPFTPRDLYYFANELRDNGRYERALEFYHRFLDTKEGWIEDILATYNKMADIYYRLGNEEKELDCIFQAFRLEAPRAEFCCRLGHYFLRQKEYRKALFWYKFATELERPKESWGFFHEACWTWLPHLQLCVCYYHIGDVQKSYEHNEVARTYRPDDPTILSNKKLLEEKLQPQE